MSAVSLITAAPGCSVADLVALTEAGKRFGVILADPPWRFTTYSENGKGRSPEQHYACMSLVDIAAMPVAALAAQDSALLLWATMPQLPAALEIMHAWGFIYKTTAFVWIKAAKHAKAVLLSGNGLHWGMGFWSRSNVELVLLGTRGAPKRLAKNVHQVIVAPVAEHSRKPDETNRRIERLLPGPYLELFARRPLAGWTVWGDEIAPADMDGNIRHADAPVRAPDLFDLVNAGERGAP